ncbi:ATP synthase F1 subunit gamma [Fodinibius sp. SL11]|uniref:ATP synthase F1 subunit gamma n=1 Tax=Fodinibius sp. SL11 TaxID=3425690 RepID=UPI003F8840E0
MANLRDIRNRIESIKNTQQITRAMKMVAAAKLRKAQDRITQTRPYASKMKEMVARLVRNSGDDNVLLRTPESTDNVLFIVVGSDRGLCGGFNNNLFKVVEKTIKKEYSKYHESGNLSLICIGRQATKYFGKRNYEVIAEYPGFWDNIVFNKATEIMKSVVGDFKAGTYDEVKLAYNEFKSVIAQNRLVESVLPIDPSTLVEDEDISAKEYIYEPDAENILQKLLPLHLNLQLWKAILESNAAEQGARMTAMDNATENAQEMKEDLQLEYNRARQSAITTEISEIISGAQALEEA